MLALLKKLILVILAVIIIPVIESPATDPVSAPVNEATDKDSLPAAAILLPAADPYATNSGKVDVTVAFDTGKNGGKIDRVELLLDGKPVDVYEPKPNNRSARGECVFPAVDLSAVANRSADLAAIAYDGKRASKPAVIQVQYDTDAPALYLDVPGLTADPRPTIRAKYKDKLSGIERKKVKILVDSVDVTPLATIEATEAVYTPIEPLDDGTHLVEVQVPDLAGNIIDMGKPIQTDTTPPAITDLLPASGTVVEIARPLLQASISDAESGVKTAKLYLYLDGSKQTGAVWANGTLSYQPTSDLSEASHTVLVTAEDNAGNSSSATWSFAVNLPDPPAVPALDPVVGIHFVGQNVTLSWTTVADAASYELIVLDGAEVAVVNLSTEGSQHIAAFAAGSYTWQVRALGTNGLYSAWSEPLSFTVYEALTAPTLLTPAADTVTEETHITFSWSPVPLATHYYLYVYNTDAGASAVATWLDGSTTSKTATLATGASYTWQVKSYEETTGLFGPASEIRNLSIANIAPPAPIDSGGGVPVEVSNPVTLSWTSVAGADYYYLSITDTGTGLAAYSGWVVAPATSHTLFLEPATYTWKVRAYASAQANWSGWTPEETIIVLPDEIPQPLSPLDGSVLDRYKPVFSWTPVDGALYYYLYVKNDDTGVAAFANWINAAQTSQAVKLDPGARYTWTVKSYITQLSDPCAAQHIETLPFNAPAPTSPADNAVNQPLLTTLAWNPVATADYYYVYVIDETAGDTTAVATWVVGPATSYGKNYIAGHAYRWQVRAYASDSGTWTAYSAARRFTIAP